MNQTTINCNCWKSLSNIKILNDYFDYWDKVIKDWMNYKSNKIEEDFIKSLNFSGEYELQEDYMPEPYWGDPRNCSIVVANFNPAGGDDQNSFTWREFANCCLLRMVTFVNNNKYSDLALDFPLWENEDWIKKYAPYLEKYGGRKWWKSKQEWINNLINSDKRPFAIELCGWHSAKWSSSSFINAWDNELIVKKYVCNHFIKPMLSAIEMCDAKLGICIGKGLGELLDKLNNCFSDESVHFSGITDKNYKISYDNVTVRGSKTSYKNIIVERSTNKKPIKRYYRVFKHNICNKYIINTWVVGSNKHPSELFYQFEKMLINAINNQ